MRLAVVENVFDCTPGILGERAAARGWEMDIRRIHKGDALPAEAEGHDALVVLGGYMAATEDVSFPHLPLTCALIRDFEAAGRQVLGICLGAQLIARAFGARNHLRRGHEIGFHPLVTLPGGLRDPLLRGLAERPLLIQWHEDTFDLPQGARLLMAGTGFRNQLFRYGPHVVGIQAHLECTPAMFREWLVYAGPGIEDRVPGIWETFAAEDSALAVQARAWAEGFIDHWLDRIAESRMHAQLAA